MLAIKKDIQQRNAGNLQLINEGGCTLTDQSIFFPFTAGSLYQPGNHRTVVQVFAHFPFLEDVAEVDVTQAFQQEGVDIDGMILLSNGNWDEDVYVVSKSDGLEEWLTEAELQERWKNCLGQFKDEVETLAGEISFTAADGADGKHCMKLHAPVFLANKNRLGIRDPLPADRIIERLNPENADLRSLPRPITKLTFGASCANGYSDIPPATVRTEWD